MAVDNLAEDKFQEERRKIRRLLRKVIDVMMADKDSKLVSPRVVLGYLTNQPRDISNVGRELPYYSPSEPWLDLAKRHLANVRKRVKPPI